MELAVNDHKLTIMNAMSHSYSGYTSDYKNTNVFQDIFETEHNCKVIKNYSTDGYFVTEGISTKFWGSLKFNSPSEATMFLLRWA
jgi:hypothetical protein